MIKKFEKTWSLSVLPGIGRKPVSTGVFRDVALMVEDMTSNSMDSMTDCHVATALDQTATGQKILLIILRKYCDPYKMSLFQELLTTDYVWPTDWTSNIFIGILCSVSDRCGLILEHCMGRWCSFLSGWRIEYVHLSYLGWRESLFEFSSSVSFSEVYDMLRIYWKIYARSCFLRRINAEKSGHMFRIWRALFIAATEKHCPVPEIRQCPCRREWRFHAEWNPHTHCKLF